MDNFKKMQIIIDAFKPWLNEDNTLRLDMNENEKTVIVNLIDVTNCDDHEEIHETRYKIEDAYELFYQLYEEHSFFWRGKIAKTRTLNDELTNTEKIELQNVVRKMFETVNATTLFEECLLGSIKYEPSPDSYKERLFPEQ